MSEISGSLDPFAVQPIRRPPLPAHSLPGGRFEQHDDFASPERGYSARAIFGILNRHKLIIFTCVFVVTLASALLSLSLPRTYLAEAMVILDTRRPEIIQQPAALSNLVSGSTADPAIVRSEVELLSSATYTRKVIEKLDLLHNPQFQLEMQPSRWSESFTTATATVEKAIATFLDRPVTTETPDPMGQAIDVLRRHLVIYNDDKSYAIAIRYQSHDPKFAALIVNTMAQLYLAEQLDNGLEVSRKADAWLGDRLGNLSTKVHDSERKVAEFEQQNHIQTVLTGTTTEQRLHELNMQLLASSDQLAQKQATLSQVQTTLKSPGGAAAAAQVLSSPLIQRLREQEADAAARSASLDKVYSSAYPGGDPRTHEFEVRIRAEVERIVASLAGDVTAGQARQRVLQAAITEEQAKLDTINAARVQLVQLQHEASANRTLYDTLMMRSQQIEADAQSLQSGARIVPAETPSIPSFPNNLLFTGFGFFGSLFLGVLLAFTAEQLDETIRTPDAAVRLTGLPNLGIVPRVRNGNQALAAIVNSPLSAYSDAINNALIASRIGDWHKTNRVIAVTSAVPNEGKTLVAAAMARAAATKGVRTLLIDCDMRRPTVAGLFGKKGSSALEPMFKVKSTDFSQYAQIDEASGLHYLPGRRMAANPQELLGSNWMSDLLARARAEYDLVVIDTPPLLTISDALLLTRVTDTTLLVVRWGHTPGGLVSEAVRMLQLHGTNALGTVLSMVDMRKYLQYRSGGYYYGGSVRRHLTTRDAY